MENQEETINPYVHPIQENTLIEYGGMTLRDHFAGLAMNGFISDREMYMAMMQDRKTTNQTPDEYIAEQSYNIADAMLKQRSL